MAGFGIQRYKINPEQLAAVQEKVQKLTAEGRRLDGSLPVQSWGELRSENHELKKKLEQANDVIDDYKRRCEEWRTENNSMRSKLLVAEVKYADIVQAEVILKADLQKARDVTQVLCSVIAHISPEIAAELGIEAKNEETKADPAVLDPAEEQRRKKREYARRYYYAHRAERLAYNAEYQRAHRKQRCEAQKRYLQRKKEAQANAEH